MGRRARLRPERLAEKLRQVRIALGLSQTEMLNRLGFDIHYSRISECRNSERMSLRYLFFCGMRA